MTKRVLIVDDNSTNLYMLESLLKGHGMEVTSAENGKDALDKARLNPPDLIVSDILMPVMDGYTLCREWKSVEQLKHIPFVFYTATYTEPNDEAFALSLGAERFIIKPQEPDILMNILKEVLADDYTVKQVAPKPLGEEMEFFRRHNEVLFKKLEKKMVDLEIANKELEILEESYRLSFENVTDVIYTIDMNFNITSMAPSVERVLGYKPQDFIGRPVTDLVNLLTPESFEQVLADIDLVLKGETITAAVYRFIAKDGTIKYSEVSGSPIISYGRIIGIISVARDISRRKLAEEALGRSEQLLKDTQTISKVGGWEYDIEKKLLTWTDEVYRIYGVEKNYNPNDIGKAISFYYEEDQQIIEKAFLNAVNTGKPYDLELQFNAADGAKKWVRTIGHPVLKDDKIIRVFGNIIDITERKQAEEKIRKLNVELEQRVIERTAQLESANSELEAFSYSVSHDLRGPLQHITGFAELLNKRAAGSLDEKNKHYLKVITDSTIRMGKLIDDLLSFSRMGRAEMMKKKTNLDSLVKEILRDFQTDIEGRAINMKIGPLPEIFGDSAMLRQVFVNLVSNAFKYTRNCDKAEIEIGSTRGKNGELCIYVKDNGAGFDMKYVDKLFGLFQRLHRTEEYEGTGVGLANVRRIIHRHGGRVWAEGKVGEGATFWFTMQVSGAGEQGTGIRGQ